MDTLIELLNTLSSLSPLAVIGLLGTIIFMMVKGKTATDEKVELLGSNHLHAMPEMEEGMREIRDTMRDMHRTMIGLDSYIRARLNGGRQ